MLPLGPESRASNQRDPCRFSNNSVSRHRREHRSRSMRDAAGSDSRTDVGTTLPQNLEIDGSAISRMEHSLAAEILHPLSPRTLPSRTKATSMLNSGRVCSREYETQCSRHTMSVFTGPTSPVPAVNGILSQGTALSQSRRSAWNRPTTSAAKLPQRPPRCRPDGPGVGRAAH